MNVVELIPALVALAIMQTIAYFSAKSALGEEANWKINNLLGLGCLVSIWGPAYAGIFAQSVMLWLLPFASGIALIVYGLRRRTAFQITMKEALLIYWRVILRLLIVAGVLGAVARVLMLIIKKTAAT